MLSQAIELAKTSPSKFRIGCIVTNKRGQVISSGVNLMLKSHPKQAEYSARVGKDECIYLHAEIAALIKCREEPHAIYVARVTKDNKSALAKPCPICQLAIKEAGVKIINWTTGDKNEKEI